jgi:molybdate transport system substrate-binding protein
MRLNFAGTNVIGSSTFLRSSMKSFLLKLSAFAFIGGAAAAGTATAVQAAELHVMSSGGFTAAYKILGPRFAATSGNTLDTALGPSMAKPPKRSRTGWPVANQRTW